MNRRANAFPYQRPVSSRLICVDQKLVLGSKYDYLSA